MRERSISDELEDFKRTSSGIAPIDELLDGGFENKTLTTIYGPAGSGKTNISLLMVKKVLSDKKKVLLIDTENSFSVERFKQIGGLKESSYDQIIILRPRNFKEQHEIIVRLKDLVDDSFGLLVVDSIAMLYRLEMSQSSDVFFLNKDFSIQISNLVDIAVNRNIPIIVTNQVYADFENKERVNMVGGDLLRYSSKCLVELKLGHNGIRQAIMKKHRSIEEGKSVMFRITSTGITSAEDL
ncbi:DNA repair and recombination protein RadB [Candidatus Woesearchaeota archaeon]|nr:DNA repair and recombination protein RadB [Candidatus Woesearchaeota archaeon]